mmetsp:Transcript_86092/g.216706  ORF Transcript_86092/g.216706 Transcript_86092/m.216706 type:complete len:315 (+) Transcript_86092:49-993(+)
MSATPSVVDVELNAQRNSPVVSVQEQVSVGLTHGTGGDVNTPCPVWLDLANLRPRQEVLLLLLRAAVAVLEAVAVPCWITGGTLIGALRHHGFIPHDDDIDLECLEIDKGRIAAAFEDSTYLTFRSGGRWRETPVAHVGLRNTDVELDIFLREAELAELSDFPSEVEVYPLRRYHFNGLELPGPASPDSFLARLYGSDWANFVRVWSHDFNDIHGLAHDPERVSMALVDYEALVKQAGYRPPWAGCPTLSGKAASAEEELEAAVRALGRLFEPGGPVEKLKAAREVSWLEKLRRKNREQAEAQLRLSGSEEVPA